MRFRDLPIRRKLLLFNVATSAATLLLVCTGFVLYELDSYRRDVLSNLETQATMIGNNVEAALLFDDERSATATLDALRDDRSVQGGAVYTPSGALFAAYAQRGHDVPELEPEMLGRSGQRWHGARLVVFHTVRSGERTIGTIVLSARLEELNERIVRYVAIAAAAFLAATLVAVAISWRAQRALSQPILHLVAIARRVSRKRDYSVRATPQGDDEIGLLIRTLNDMLAQIQERDRELHAARDEAEAANRAKDDFLAVVSHELRTPLTPILAWSSLLRQGRLTPETTLRAIEIIDRNAHVQAQLINDLLDVSRIVSGKMKLDVRVIELAPVIESALDAIRPSAVAKGIRLESDLDPHAGSVRGDPGRLEQVFWNLLANAVKFTPEGGTVSVTLARRGDTFEVAVSDTGEGIDPAFVPHVFDRFRQQDASSTRTHGGLGLGLSIVRYLAELHGGRVSVESRGRGEGATFRVFLPAVAAAEPAPGESAMRGHAHRGPALPAGLRVLLVDDDADTLETVGTVLASAGADVRTAPSAEQAMAVFDEWRPDVLVSDIGMPYEDGYALIRRVRALPSERGGQVPALALTAYARSEDCAALLSAGFQRHVAKPVEQAELVAAIGDLVRSPDPDHATG